jgi:hypothetical protein
MAESRGILIESVGNGYQSKGFQLYERLAGPGLGETGDTYRCYLFSIFDEFALDLKVLFDRCSPQGRLFPRETALLDLLKLLNDQELAHLWAEDESIGWVYQYFNSKEERKKMRDESAAPRNSRELAVRNQFFTPRYVVEFLTDNTLGRIWYEMTQGETSLKDSCRYLVRRPTEIFLKDGEKAPEQPDDENLSQEELLKQPFFIQFRPLKDPRTLRMLDPACGSMHFGLYAFDLYEQIYDESWELEARLGTAAFVRESGLKPLAESYQDKEAFLQDVPRLIIEHNVHGIDIDPRAAQIAGLSLWLRAQRSWHNQGVKPVDRPRITRSNIVCAEPMPGEKELLREFTASLEVPALGYLVEQVFDKMQLAGEAGSLLKIEEEIRDIIAEAKRQWKAGPKLTQMGLFGEVPAKPEQIDLPLDFSGITDERFWESAEDKLYQALQDYAEIAGDHGYQRRLFAEDAARGFAFIDLCRKRYDAVVMNPPFGEGSDSCLEYFDKVYPTWNSNMLCASLQRGWEITSSIGVVGAIYDRTAIVKSSYEGFRRAVLVADDRLALLADLGWEVLDANVEVTTSVLRRVHDEMPGVFLDIRNAESGQKGIELLNSLRVSQADESRIPGIEIRGSEFQQFPNAVVGYDFPEFLRRAFEDGLSLSSSGYSAYTGHQFKTDQHFRLWWETSSLSPPQFIARIFKGAGFCPFWAPLRDVLISQIDIDQLPNNSSTNLRNRDQHLKPGICFGKRGEYFCAHVLPSGHFFSLEGLAIPVPNPALVFEMLGVLNTPLTRASLNRFAGQHKTSGYVNLFPYRRISDGETVRDKVEKAVLALLNAQRFDESLSYFQGIPGMKTIKQLAETIEYGVQEGLRHSIECENISHVLVLDSYSVLDSDRQALEAFRLRQPQLESPLEDADTDSGCIWFASHSTISSLLGVIFGRWDIRHTTGERDALELSAPFAPLPVIPPGMLQNAQCLPAAPQDVPAEYPLHITWLGILVDDKGHNEDIAVRVSEAIEVIWKEKSGDIEHEACEILGVRSLRDYFGKPSGFFADHLKRYSKSRRQAPIYWPLSTPSGSYTLWLYYHRLNDQTLYTCVNDFVEPKLTDVAAELAGLRQKGSGRTRDDEKRLEKLQDLEIELQEFRDELLRLARLPWKPNLNDGVQITAAPLWKLFQLPKWKKTLKETWEKLEKGDYDWAHLAYSIWPDRVTKKCVTDKSLAIAHGLEELYVEPPASAKKKRGKKAAVVEDDEE